MNLFLLSWNPIQCARWHCDKHVVKMILELVQMLYTAWHVNNSYVPRCAPLCKSTGNRGYKRLSNPNHPMAKWVRESLWNYTFTIQLATALCLEFQHRYGHIHGCTYHLLWLSEHTPKFDTIEKTHIPQCMPEKYKADCPVQAYRNYYLGDKVAFASWSNKRQCPSWW